MSPFWTRRSPHPEDAGAAAVAQHDEGNAHPHREDREGELPRIALVGAGRVGTTLGVAFARAGWSVTAVASRDAGRREGFQALVPGARAFREPAAVLDEADLVFLTVPDDALPGVAAGLRLYSGQALVHTSGLLPSTVLAPAMAAGTAHASFHPLVGFADQERALRDLSGATVAIEGDEGLVGLLAELAEAIGAQPVVVPVEGKAAYHAAAVLAAGGLVALLDAIVELGRGAGLDEPGSLAIYGPLVRQTVANAEAVGVERALTGPVVRGDVGTVRAHLAAMRALAPGAVELYVALARREIALAEARSDLSGEAATALRRVLADGA